MDSFYLSWSLVYSSVFNVPVHLHDMTAEVVVLLRLLVYCFLNRLLQISNRCLKLSNTPIINGLLL